MITCPNINSEEWKTLEKEVGEAEAIKLYILNDEQIPTLEQIEDLRVEEYSDPYLPERVESTKKLMDIRKSIQLTLNSTLKIYNGRKAKLERGKKSKEHKALNQIVLDLKTTIRDFQNADVVESLSIFLNNTNGILYAMDTKLDKLKAKNKEEDSNSPLAFTLSQINQGLEILKSFDVIDDIKDYVNNTDDISSELAQKVNKEINSIQDKKIKLYSTFINTSKSLVADKLASVSTIETARRREELELKYKRDIVDFTKSGDKRSVYDEKMRQWVDNKLTQESAQLRQKERARIYKLLNESPGDISSTAAWIIDPRNITEDDIIKTTVALLDQESNSLRIEFMEDRAKMANEFESFIEKIGSKNVSITDQRELYKNMIEKDKDGNYTGYYTRQVKYEYYQDLDELRAELAEVEDLKDVFLNEYNELNEEPEKNKARLLEIQKKGQELRERAEKANKEFFKKYKTEKPTSTQDIAEWEDTNVMYYDPETKDYRLNSYIKPSMLSEQYKDLSKDPVRFDYYNKLVDFNRKSDKLVKGSGKGLYMRLPSIRVKTNEIINRAGSFKQGAKDVINRSIEDAFKINTDDSSYGDLTTNEKGEVVQVAGTQSGEQYKTVSVPFRAKLPIEEQSFDLTGMALSNRYVSLNYDKKNKLKDTLELTLELVGERKYVKTSPGTHKKMQQVLKKAFRLNEDEEKEITQQIKADGKLSNSYKLLNSIVEDRLYGLSSIPGGEIAGMSVDKMANSLMGFAANQMLILNWGSGTANVAQGKVMNFLGSVQGDVYTKRNLLRGEKKYGSASEILDNLKDLGRLAPKSKTNLLMESLIGDSVGFDGFVNDFTQDSQIKRIGQVKNLHMVNNMAEHYIQGTLLYAILDTYKAKNSNGDYIDINKNVVDKDKAATLDEIIQADGKGSLTVLSGFIFDGINLPQTENITKQTLIDYPILREYYTVDKKGGITQKGGGNIKMDIITKAISPKIQDIIADLQGNYSQEQKAMAQRYWYGKLGFFLKKFVIRGVQSRWKGIGTANKSKEDLELHLRGYSEASGKFKEGTYTSLWRFMRELKNHKDQLSKEMLTKNWNELTKTERGNIKKAVMELGIMIGALMSAKLLADLADEEDSEAIWFSAYLTRRLWNELFFFTPVSALSGEAVRFLESPTAAMNILKTTGLLIDSLIDDFTSFEFHEFESGRRKGEYKSWVYLNKTLNPFYKNFVDYSYRDKYNFAANAR